MTSTHPMYKQTGKKKDTTSNLLAITTANTTLSPPRRIAHIEGEPLTVVLMKNVPNFSPAASPGHLELLSNSFPEIPNHETTGLTRQDKFIKKERKSSFSLLTEGKIPFMCYPNRWSALQAHLGKNASHPRVGQSRGSWGSIPGAVTQVFCVAASWLACCCCCSAWQCNLFLLTPSKLLKMGGYFKLH